jgi:hypothetical protein
VPTRIPASERTSQKLAELLSQAVADGDAWAELLKLAARRSWRKRWRPRSPKRWDVPITRTAPRRAPAITTAIAAAGCGFGLWEERTRQLER